MDGNEQNHEELGNPQDFLNSLQGNGEAPTDQPAIPEKIGEIPTEDFLNGVSGYTEGKIKSLEDFNNVLSYQDKFSKLQQEYEQIKAQSQISPFANDFTQEINRLVKDGASQEEVVHFIQLQQMDVDAMSDKQAIIMAKKLSLKGNQMTDAKLEQWYEQTYGNPLDEDDDEPKPLTAKQEMDIIEAGQSARQSLFQLKVDSGEPASVVRQRKAQQSFESSYQKWGEVISGSIGKQDVQQFTAELLGDANKDENGNQKVLGIDYKIPEQTKNFIVQQTAQYAAQNNLRFTEEDFGKVQNFAKWLMWGELGPQIYAAGIRDAYAKANQTVTKQHHNVRNINDNSQAKKNVDPQVQNSMASYIKKMKPF